jgi:hypothetical protein
MPGKNRAFTTLVDPVSPPSIPLHERERMVEAPGTAPGSDTLMPRGVYRHSRFPDTPYIGVRRVNLKVFASAANETARRLRRNRVWATGMETDLGRWQGRVGR